MTDRGAASDATERDLLAAVCLRDIAAHRALFDAYYSRVFSFVVRRLRDPELAQETVADVFFELWRSADRFTGSSRVSTWIFGIAQFKCLSADRNRRRAKRRRVLPTNIEFLHAVPDERLLEDSLQARDELRQLVDRLEELPAGQREVLRLVFVEELEYQEIGERLGISVGTVKSRIARARRDLRRATGRGGG